MKGSFRNTEIKNHLLDGLAVKLFHLSWNYFSRYPNTSDDFEHMQAMVQGLTHFSDEHNCKSLFESPHFFLVSLVFFPSQYLHLCFPEKLKEKKSLWIEASKQRGTFITDSINYLPLKLQEDQSFIKQLIINLSHSSDTGGSILQAISISTYRQSKSFFLDLWKCHGPVITSPLYRYMDVDTVQIDPEIVHLMIHHNPRELCFANKQNLLETISFYCQNQWSTIYDAVYKSNGSFYLMLPNLYQCDKSLAKVALEHNPSIFRYMPTIIQQDYHMALVAVQYNADNWSYVHRDLKQSDDFIIQVMAVNPLVFSHIDVDDKIHPKNKQQAIQFMRATPISFEKLPDKFKSDIDVLRETLKSLSSVGRTITHSLEMTLMGQIDGLFQSFSQYPHDIIILCTHTCPNAIWQSKYRDLIFNEEIYLKEYMKYHPKKFHELPEDARDKENIVTCAVMGRYSNFAEASPRLRSDLDFILQFLKKYNISLLAYALQPDVLENEKFVEHFLDLIDVNTKGAFFPPESPEVLSLSICRKMIKVFPHLYELLADHQKRDNIIIKRVFFSRFPHQLLEDETLKHLDISTVLDLILSDENNPFVPLSSRLCHFSDISLLFT